LIPGRRPRLRKTKNAAPIRMRPGCRSGSPAERTATLSRATLHRRFDRRFGHRVCPPRRRRRNSDRRQPRRPSALGLGTLGVRAADGGARKRAYDQALRPPQRPSHARSGGTDSAIAALSQFECRLMTPKRFANETPTLDEVSFGRIAPSSAVGVRR